MSQELSLIAFTCFSCLAAGIFLAVTVAQVKEYPEQPLFWASTASFICLAIGGAAAIMNLGHPEMVLGALGHPTSGIFLELVSSALFGFLLIIYLFARWRGASENVLKWTSYLGSFAAFLLLFALGRNFIMEWRPALNTYTLALPFIGWGLGCAGYTLAVLSSFDEDEDKSPWQPAVWGSAIALTLTAVYFIALWISPSEEAAEAFGNTMTGSYAAVLWGGVVICGICVPIILSLLTKAKRPVANYACMAFTVIGTASFQWLLFQLGTASWQFFKYMK